MVHVYETSHPGNGESTLRWRWLAASDDLVNKKIQYSHSTNPAKAMLGEDYSGFVISDQCPSYNWVNPDKHQICWAHIKRLATNS